MHRFVDGPRPKMVTVRTVADKSGEMVELYVEAGGQEMLAGSISPNLLRGAGVPIDVRRPDTWAAKVKLSEAFFKKLGK